MRTTLTRMHRDERGMSLVFVGVGFMAFLAATTLAIDVGMFATARSQAQNSADAGALSGAVALYFDDYNNRSASGPAVQSALAAARSNDVINQPGERAAGRCHVPDIAFGPEQPRARACLPHERARQSASDADGALLRRRYRQH